MGLRSGKSCPHRNARPIVCGGQRAGGKQGLNQELGHSARVCQPLGCGGRVSEKRCVSSGAGGSSSAPDRGTLMQGPGPRSRRNLSRRLACARPRPRSFFSFWFRMSAGHTWIPSSFRSTLWPSGLRRWTQVPLSSDAWVRTPQVSYVTALWGGVAGTNF